MTYARQFSLGGVLTALVAPVGLLLYGVIRGGLPNPFVIFAVLAAGGVIFLGAAGWMIGRREDALLSRNAELRGLSDQLKTQAVTDDLTRIANRRSFDIDLARDITRAHRYHTPLALIMIDIDHFKAFNDNHGHQAGDRVLKDVAQVLESEKRQGDLIARYGGEEFAAILPHTNATEAAVWAERVRQKLDALPIVTDRGVLRVTASFGVADIDGIAASPAALIAASDGALYRAKASGRNCVWIESGAGQGRRATA